MNNILTPTRPVSQKHYPAGEMAPCPQGHMYSALDWERLPVDNHGRIVTGYGRDNLTTGERMHPQRTKIADIYVPQKLFLVQDDNSVVVEVVEDYGDYAECIDGVMFVVRHNAGSDRHRIVYHAQDEADALHCLQSLASTANGRVGLRENGRVVGFPRKLSSEIRTAPSAEARRIVMEIGSKEYELSQVPYERWVERERIMLEGTTSNEELAGSSAWFDKKEIRLKSEIEALKNKLGRL